MPRTASNDADPGFQEFQPPGRPACSRKTRWCTAERLLQRCSDRAVCGLSRRGWPGVLVPGLGADWVIAGTARQPWIGAPLLATVACGSWARLGRCQRWQGMPTARSPGCRRSPEATGLWGLAAQSPAAEPAFAGNVPGKGAHKRRAQPTQCTPSDTQRQRCFLARRAWTFAVGALRRVEMRSAASPARAAAR